MIKLEDHSGQLELVRKRIGAALTDWEPGAEGLSEREQIRAILKEGIDLTLDQIKTTGGLFDHEGEQVVIYIKDHTHMLERQQLTPSDLAANPEKCRRVHLMECKTIEDMRSKGRFDRYVVTNRRDNLYKIDVIEKHPTVIEVEQSLRPCKNCLKELNYKSYNDATRPVQNGIFAEFDIEAFLEDFSTFFADRPIRWANQSGANEYIKNWSALSRKLRAANHWTCQDCGVNLGAADHQKYLHVHHVNGVKGDNNAKNLEVVCHVCHANKPGHNHMHTPGNVRAAINRKKQQQGLLN